MVALVRMQLPHIFEWWGRVGGNAYVLINDRDAKYLAAGNFRHLIEHFPNVWMLLFLFC